MRPMIFLYRRPMWMVFGDPIQTGHACCTKWTVQTGTINADYATISAENTIDLSFTVKRRHWDRISTRLLQQSAGGTFIAIDSIITSDTIIHLNDDTPFTSGIFYYKLQMINNCGTMFTESNLANNIILSGTQSGSVVFFPGINMQTGLAVLKDTG